MDIFGLEQTSGNFVEIPKRPFSIYLNLPGISDEILQSFFMTFLHSSTGHFWFGSWEYGLFRYDPVTDEVVNHKHDPNDPNSLGGMMVGSFMKMKKEISGWEEVLHLATY
jgi:hypothetical protein